MDQQPRFEQRERSIREVNGNVSATFSEVNATGVPTAIPHRNRRYVTVVPTDLWELLMAHLGDDVAELAERYAEQRREQGELELDMRRTA